MESICTAKSWTKKGLIRHLDKPNNRDQVWDMAGFVLHYRLIVHSNLYPMDCAASEKGKKLWSKWPGRHVGCVLRFMK